MLVLFALVVGIAARTPFEAALTCSIVDKANAWLNGVQDSAVMTLQTLFGGFTCDGQLHDACFEKAELMDAVLCVSTDDYSCLECDLAGQLAIDPDECCQNGEPEATMDGSSVCRTVRQWIAIAFDKLALAQKTVTRCSLVDEAATTQCQQTIDFACAAERILASVLDALASEFIDDGASYRHILSPAGLALFGELSALTAEVRIRTLQSFRSCNTEQCTNHTLISTYSTLTYTQYVPLPVGQSQLIWPISGSISPFDYTDLPTDNRCSMLSEDSPNIPNPDPGRRLPTLGHLDSARVMPVFSFCGGMPCQSCVRSFNDLSMSRCCNTLPLIADIGAALRTVAGEQRAQSTAYVSHFRSTITYESNPTRDVHIERALMLRNAAADQCSDDPPVQTFTPTADLDTSQLVGNRPLTLPAAVSLCVGGSASGQTCTARNECGVGMACTVRPGGEQGYCFDGSWWNAAMPCSVRSAQCPFGECYGAVSGDEGGVFPYLHVWRENHCDEPAEATLLCNDPRVREWHLHQTK